MSEKRMRQKTEMIKLKDRRNKKKFKGKEMEKKQNIYNKGKKCEKHSEIIRK